MFRAIFKFRVFCSADVRLVALSNGSVQQCNACVHFAAQLVPFGVCVCVCVCACTESDLCHLGQFFQLLFLVEMQRFNFVIYD